MMTFFDRFTAAILDGPIFGLQIVYPEPWHKTAEDVDLCVRAYHPHLHDAILEWETTATIPNAQELISDHGPPAVALGLISWGGHIIKLAAFDAPMPYGPIASCVAPALMPPEVKQDAAAHQSHVLLYHAGPETEPTERMLALALAAGALSTLGATAILHEEARTAVPAFDLWPSEGEDIIETLRAQPLLYLFAGFVRTNVAAPERPWIRTFGCSRFNLPDLAVQAQGYGEASAVFAWFNAILNYLKTTDAGFHPGQSLQLNDELAFLLRTPHDSEADFLESDGTMIVLERAV